MRSSIERAHAAILKRRRLRFVLSAGLLAVLSDPVHAFFLSFLCIQAATAANVRRRKSIGCNGNVLYIAEHSWLLDNENAACHNAGSLTYAVLVKFIA